MDNTILTEAILKEAAGIACHTEDSFYKEEIDNCTHRFSKKYKKKMKKLVECAENPQGENESHIRCYKIPRKKYILIAAIIVLMASMTVIAVEPIREKVIQLIEKCFSEYTEVSFQDLTGKAAEDYELPEKFEVQKLTYVPENYKMEEETIDETFYLYDCGYVNEEGSVLWYEQCAVKYSDAAITSDGNPAKVITIKGKEAYWLRDKYDWNTIIYVNGDYVYTLSAKETIYTLTDIFEKNKNIP